MIYISKYKIKQARQIAGLTQKQAAELINMSSYRTWQNWELGSRKMSKELFDKFIAKIDIKSILENF